MTVWRRKILDSLRGWCPKVRKPYTSLLSRMNHNLLVAILGMTLIVAVSGAYFIQQLSIAGASYAYVATAEGFFGGRGQSFETPAVVCPLWGVDEYRTPNVTYAIRIDSSNGEVPILINFTDGKWIGDKPAKFLDNYWADMRFCIPEYWGEWQDMPPLVPYRAECWIWLFDKSHCTLGSFWHYEDPDKGETSGSILVTRLAENEWRIESVRGPDACVFGVWFLDGGSVEQYRVQVVFNVIVSRILEGEG